MFSYQGLDVNCIRMTKPEVVLSSSSTWDEELQDAAVCPDGLVSRATGPRASTSASPTPPRYRGPLQWLSISYRWYFSVGEGVRLYVTVDGIDTVQLVSGPGRNTTEVSRPRLECNILGLSQPPMLMKVTKKWTFRSLLDFQDESGLTVKYECRVVTWSDSFMSSSGTLLRPTHPEYR